MALIISHFTIIPIGYSEIMRLDNNTQAFFNLVKAGLWGNGNPDIQIDGTTDWNIVYQLAQEQSVQGLVLAGLELSDLKPPKELLLQWIGEVQMIEQHNKAMNAFIAGLVAKLRAHGIYTLLVKGQGVAQCYERPSWRACGDVDFLLSKDNYEKAKSFLCSIASSVDDEDSYSLHLGMIIDSWSVELHGSLHSGLSKRIDKVLDEVQDDLFYGGNVRSWQNGNTQIFLPGVNCDVLFVFSHILQHFFKGGIGFRQVGDWCRLLWTYKDSLNYGLLESRIRKMGLMSEWKAFGYLAVNKLGMPEDAMPFYSSRSIWKYKANRILSFILETGNFGHNRDKSIYEKHDYIIYKAISLWLNTKDSFRHFLIFPKDAICVWFWRFREGILAVANGK